MKTPLALLLAGTLVPAVASAQDQLPMPPPPQPTTQPGPAAPGPGAPGPAAPGPYAPHQGPYAQPPPGAPGYVAQAAPQRGAHQHEGLYIRMYVGPGFTVVAEDSNDLSYSGGGASVGIAVGGSVTRNLIVYGELAMSGTNEPELEMGSAPATRQEDLNISVGGIGAGVAYYFLRNYYVSGTLSLTQVQMDIDGDKVYESDTGAAFTAMAGKEWWVSANWGIGVAAMISAGGMKASEGSDNNLSTASGAVVFSATFD